MSEKAADSSGAFDLEKLKELIEMMEKHGLTEVSLKHGDEQWRLRRGHQEPVPMLPAHPLPPAAMAPPAASPPPSQSSDEASDESGVFIKSPTVGTFYASPSPDDPPFVKVGSVVQPDTIVCIVEAMKVFNQIPAEVSGTIVEVLVKNGEPVEFGQALFRIRP